ncbi:MAG: hypothetical protein CMF70_06750 [Magnetovibrio sp.]|nr:hypothetical protein [Magnetovibrio sp.]
MLHGAGIVEVPFRRDAAHVQGPVELAQVGRILVHPIAIRLELPAMALGLLRVVVARLFARLVEANAFRVVHELADAFAAQHEVQRRLVDRPRRAPQVERRHAPPDGRIDQAFLRLVRTAAVLGAETDLGGHHAQGGPFVEDFAGVLARIARTVVVRKGAAIEQVVELGDVDHRIQTRVPDRLGLLADENVLPNVEGLVRPVAELAHDVRVVDGMVRRPANGLIDDLAGHAGKRPREAAAARPGGSAHEQVRTAMMRSNGQGHVHGGKWAKRECGRQVPVSMGSIIYIEVQCRVCVCRRSFLNFFFAPARHAPSTAHHHDRRLLLGLPRTVPSAHSVQLHCPIAPRVSSCLVGAPSPRPALRRVPWGLARRPRGARLPPRTHCPATGLVVRVASRRRRGRRRRRVCRRRLWRGGTCVCPRARDVRVAVARPRGFGTTDVAWVTY